jgi:hypothetical protein
MHNSIGGPRALGLRARLIALAIISVLVAATGVLISAPPARAAVGSTPQQAALILKQAHDVGTLTTVPASIYDKEIAPIANGTAPASGCEVDLRVFQVLDLALQWFGKVEVTDIQRPCIGSQLNCGAPTYSVHCASPGAAVDIDRLGDTYLHGNESINLQFLNNLDSVAIGNASNSIGANVGQSNCRTTNNWTHLNEFSDTCNHQHIDFRNISAPLNISSSGGTANTLFQLHADGAVFAYTGSPCGPSGCNGWGQINGAGSGVSKMAADNGNLYILLSNGAIFKYNGNPCDSTGCHGWTQLNGAGSSATQITAEAGALWMLRSDGAIFKYNGNPCGSSGCNGWTQYNGAGSGATQIVAGTNSAGVPAVNMLRSDGAIYQSTAPCGSTCSGWAAINGAGSGATQMTARGKDLFILLSSGAIFQYTQQMCDASGCHGWAQLNGGGSGTVEISAGTNAAGMSVVNMRRNDGAIFQYTGQACDANGCRGWAQLNGAGSGVVQMTGSDSNLFIRRNDGALFQYTQQACDASGCHGWIQLDGTASTSQIAG